MGRKIDPEKLQELGKEYCKRHFDDGCGNCPLHGNKTCISENGDIVIEDVVGDFVAIDFAIFMDDLNTMTKEILKEADDGKDRD